jgi:hypothetical protein
MAWTYNTAVPDDIARVRFHIGDTTESGALFTDDAEITFIISEAGDYKKAVIWCIQNVLARINADPDFSADWLKVDQESARTHWEWLLAEKRATLGVTAQSNIISSSNVHVYRGDSLATEEPDW